MTIKIQSLDDLTPDEHNANEGSERGMAALEHSIQSVGFGRSILVDRNGKVIAGNKTLESAAEKGLGVHVVQTSGDMVVVHQRMDLDLDDDEHNRARSMAFADNRVAELNLAWKPIEILAAQKIEVDLEHLFNDSELNKMLKDLQPPPDAPDAQLDRADELRKKWGTKRGQVWEIGAHRLMCGDCAIEEDYTRLECDPLILVADPPYSSGGRQDGGKRNSTSIGTRGSEEIARDNLTTRGYISLIARTLANVRCDIAYLFTDWRMWQWTFDALESSGYPVRNMLVWDKGVMGMGFPWRNQHELIAFGKRSSGELLSGKVSNVLQFARTQNDKHPTEKPVDLLKEVIDNNTSGDVYDPFLGSGTTMVAAEQLGRVCYGMEIEPKYVGVALERMADMGLKPSLISD